MVLVINTVGRSPGRDFALFPRNSQDCHVLLRHIPPHPSIFGTSGEKLLAHVVRHCFPRLSQKCLEWEDSEKRNLRHARILMPGR
jgi:hypothetical protein